jgi:hypothetical protein
MNKTKFQITVTNSLNQDGSYIVEVENEKSLAKTKRKALFQCKKENKIQGSQSGTEYHIRLI